MKHRRLGRSGLLVSEIGLGTVLLGTLVDDHEARAIVDQALDAGVNLIDTSDSYGSGASESALGAILGARRHEVVLATKFSSPMSEAPWQRGTSRRWVTQAAEASLRRLRTDVIDLYQIHHPDPRTPIEETLHALDDLVAGGKVRYVGYSNVGGWQVADGQWTARALGLAVPISTTSHFNLAHRDPERELLPAIRAHGVGLLPYYPLESGFLTGKYQADRPGNGIRLVNSARAGTVLTAANFARLARWEAFATERGRPLVELAIGWLLSHPEVGSVIAGVTSAEQLRANIAASGWRLDAAEMAALDDLP